MGKTTQEASGRAGQYLLAGEGWAWGYGLRGERGTCGGVGRGVRCVAGSGEVWICVWVGERGMGGGWVWVRREGYMGVCG